MSKYQFSPSQLVAIKRMKTQGFTHGKIELEAQLDRDSSYESCDSCDEGTNECYDCDGSGVTETTDESDNGTIRNVTALCTTCDGDGYYTCGACDGDWENSSYGDSWDDDRCKEYLLDHVSPQARAALVFGLFYDDGSVDSEFTFTLAVDDLHYAPEYIDAFNLLADEITSGRGVQTGNAGMHLSVLTGSRYPDGQKNLDVKKLLNFQTEVTKLLPALYFVASPDHASRGLNFRHPRIGWVSDYGHGGDRYNAITIYAGQCLEYRLFETCYQRPEALLEDFEVIANTLKYYSTRKINLPTRELKSGGRNYSVGRFYQTPEALQALNSGLPFLKPKDKTISKLKSERGFSVTLKELKLKQRILEAKYAKDYAKYLQAVEHENDLRTIRVNNERDDLRQSIADPGELNSYAQELRRATTPELVATYIANHYSSGTPMTLPEYISQYN